MFKKALSTANWQQCVASVVIWFLSFSAGLLLVECFGASSNRKELPASVNSQVSRRESQTKYQEKLSSQEYVRWKIQAADLVVLGRPSPVHNLGRYKGVIEIEEVLFGSAPATKRVLVYFGFGSADLYVDDQGYVRTEPVKGLNEVGCALGRWEQQAVHPPMVYFLSKPIMVVDGWEYRQALNFESRRAEEAGIEIGTNELVQLVKEIIHQEKVKRLSGVSSRFE